MTDDFPIETRFVLEARVGRGGSGDVFRAVDMSTEQFEFRGHTRIKQIQYLLETRQIDDHYYWIDPPGREFADDTPAAGDTRASA